MQAFAWKLATKDKKNPEYMLQVNNISGIRARNKALKAVQGWKMFGSGRDPDNKNELLIFTRKFDTIREWIKWAKEFPFSLQELNRNNKPKPIKLGLQHQKTKRRKKRN